MKLSCFISFCCDLGFKSDFFQEKVAKGTAGSGFNVKASIEDEESESDSDDDYDGCEETSLEAYTTPLDEDDCPVDEYNIFKDVLGAIQVCFTNFKLF